MSSPGSRNVITLDDIETAQAVIDAWTAEGRPGQGNPESLPYLRGLITQALADKRGEGYEEGVERGRREVLDSLDNGDAL